MSFRVSFRFSHNIYIYIYRLDEIPIGIIRHIARLKKITFRPLILFCVSWHWDFDGSEKKKKTYWCLTFVLVHQKEVQAFNKPKPTQSLRWPTQPMLRCNSDKLTIDWKNTIIKDKLTSRARLFVKANPNVRICWKVKSNREPTCLVRFLTNFFFHPTCGFLNWIGCCESPQSHYGQ